MSAGILELDASQVEALASAVSGYGERAEEAINEVLHDEAGPLIYRKINPLIHPSGRTFKGAPRVGDGVRLGVLRHDEEPRGDGQGRREPPVPLLPRRRRHDRPPPGEPAVFSSEEASPRPRRSWSGASAC